jgi:hypothetical protein
VSGLIDKSFCVAKTQIAKKSSMLKALSAGRANRRFAALRPPPEPLIDA